MASPSRSSSVASQTVEADFTAFLVQQQSFLFTIYFIYCLESVFDINRFDTTLTFLAIDRMCPMLDSTLKSLPRYFSIVLALAGFLRLLSYSYCFRLVYQTYTNCYLTPATSKIANLPQRPEVAAKGFNGAGDFQHSHGFEEFSVWQFR